MPPRAVSDPTPESVRGALEVVARHGYLALENLAALEPEEWEAIQRCIREFRPDLFAQLADAYAPGDRVGLYYAKTLLCGLLNRWFDEEATRNLHTLPEEERERVRALPVNAETWSRLQARSRWHMAHPHQYRRLAPRRSRHSRRRRTATARRTRAGASRDGPGADDDGDGLDPLPAGLVPGFTAASERLSRHLQRGAAATYVR